MLIVSTKMKMMRMMKTITKVMLMMFTGVAGKLGLSFIFDPGAERGPRLMGRSQEIRTAMRMMMIMMVMMIIMQDNGDGGKDDDGDNDDAGDGDDNDGRCTLGCLVVPLAGPSWQVPSTSRPTITPWLLNHPAHPYSIPIPHKQTYPYSIPIT